MALKVGIVANLDAVLGHALHLAVEHQLDPAPGKVVENHEI